jgi:3-oxoacyl-[acyl-carrier-protein] synthase III
MQRCRIESLGVSLPRCRLPALLAPGSVRHAVVAGRRCLAASSYHPADVRVLVNAGVHRDRHICEPAMAAYIQHRLGINVDFQGRRTLAFDLSNGGCGMLNAIHVVSSLIASGEVQVGLVVASEVNSDRHPDPAYPYRSSGAAVLLDVSPRDRVGFGGFAFHTHDQHADLCTSVVSLAEPRGRLLVRRAPELEEAFLAAAPAVVGEVLAGDGLRPEEVDLVVPTQVSAAFLRRLPGVIGFPAERVVDLTDRLGDTLTTSPFLALHLARVAGRVPSGARVLLLAFGSGVTVGAATYSF